MIDLKSLLKAGVHFGHKSALWSPRMKPFIWGVRNKVHLFDISKTSFLLNQAGEFLKQTAAEGKSVLWVGTKRPAQPTIERAGKSLKMPFVINRWIGGTLSNFDQIRKAITRLLHLRDVLAKSSSASHYTKKELGMLSKEVDRLEKNVGGIIDLSYPPAALIAVDAKREASAIREAKRVGIPIICLVDTNSDPSGINFVIPGNDDSPRSIECVVDHLISFVEEGQKIYKEKKAEEKEYALNKSKDKKVPVRKEAAVKKEVAPKQEAPAKKEDKPKVVAKQETVEKKVEAKKEDTKKVEAKEAAAPKVETKKAEDKKEPAKK
jgi:small subunit ribosomal protein S2